MGLAGLHLVNHGGKCCGVKTVMGFSYGVNAPEKLQPPLDKTELSNQDAHGNDVNSELRFFHEAAPAETSLDRLKRYIDYMKRRRPGNILEAILAGRMKDQPGYESWADQISTWESHLLDLGFKEVNRQVNSNSSNTCVIYHLNIDEDWIGKWDGTPAESDDDDDDDWGDDED